MNDRILPQNPDVERSVLGSMIISTDTLYRGVEILDSTYFYLTAHGLIFLAMLDLYSKKIPVDLVTVTNNLKNKEHLDQVGGETYLCELVENVSTTTNIDAHVEILKQSHALRLLISACTNVINQCFNFDGDLPGVFRSLDIGVAAASRVVENKKSIRSIADIIPDTLKQIETNFLKKSHISGVTSGIQKLDLITSGWQKSDLIIVGATTGMGKTGLALTMAINAAMVQGKPPLIFSLEMSETQLCQRAFAIDSGINLQSIRSGKLNNNEYMKLGLSSGKLAQIPIYIDDTSAQKVTDIKAKTRRAIIEFGIELIIIDYLQLTKLGERVASREIEISNIAYFFKSMAKDFNIPVIALSQLSRKIDERPMSQRRPVLSDLRESGGIEQAADVVLFIYREEKYIEKPENKGLAELIIGKQRNGPVGIVDVKYTSHTTHFENINTGDFGEENLQPELWQNKF